MEIASYRGEFNKLKTEELEDLIRAKLNNEEDKLHEMKIEIKEKIPFPIKIEREILPKSVVTTKITKIIPEKKKELDKKVDEIKKDSDEKSSKKEFSHVKSPVIKPKVQSQVVRTQKTLDVSRGTRSVTTSKPVTKSSSPRMKKAQIQPKKPERFPKKSASPSPAAKLIKPQSKITLITSKAITDTFVPGKWLNIKEIIKNLHITDIKDARFLQLKLKQLTREKKLAITIKQGKIFYKMPK
jgi:hypothetical protein